MTALVLWWYGAAALIMCIMLFRQGPVSGRRAGVEKGGKAQREAESWLGFDTLRVVRRGLFQWMMLV